MAWFDGLTEDEIRERVRDVFAPEKCARWPEQPADWDEFHEALVRAALERQKKPYVPAWAVPLAKSVR